MTERKPTPDQTEHATLVEIWRQGPPKVDEEKSDEGTPKPSPNSR